MIYRTLTNQNRWMTLVIGLLALCTLFALGAAGQAKADKPLPAASRANLIGELKEVVSKSVLDDEKTAAVGQKWESETNVPRLSCTDTRGKCRHVVGRCASPRSRCTMHRFASRS